ncbi:carbon storage regulator CsrA [Aminithiophilus ramosus]|uniref:Translational regulator CsrA n=2 Tax=Synergistales TaxID=649776 RepID=A0A9Q7ADK7_9BACT|nr:carbon storage regulator CsrA [Aminithiophilus ramosus]QTX31474.1 carbon storage regulator CsrA [Aminithiophilus ramosus]QVL35284.1 carbon storage regulator CsrA [Synergistota bacterium]
MLALSRKKGESLLIGDDIEVVVVDVKGDQVRLGIKAPRDYVILRSELVDAVRLANRRAAQVAFVPADLLKKRREDR